MTEQLHNRFFDYGLNELDTAVTKLTICNANPGIATYTNANNSPGDGTAGFKLGEKTGHSMGTIADRAGGGREIDSPQITNGSIVSTGTASHWALLDTANSRILAWGTLSSTQAVTEGNTFTLTSFKIGIPDPA